MSECDEVVGDLVSLIREFISTVIAKEYLSTIRPYTRESLWRTMNTEMTERFYMIVEALEDLLKRLPKECGVRYG